MKVPGKTGNLFMVIILLASFIQLSAQSDHRISCVSMVREDTIILRWVPGSVPVWQSGIKHGYIIKRYTIARDGQFIPDALNNVELLTPSPIRPAGNEYFDSLAASDSRASVVQEAIYNPELLNPDAGFMSFMQKYEDTEVRFGFALFMCDLSPAIAEAAGLFFSDDDVSKGERYVYSISLANTPEGIEVEPTIIVVDADELTILPQVDDIQAIFLDRSVKFRWPITFYKGVYTAYIIEKSDDGKNYKPVSELPLVNFSENENPDYFIFTDSLSDNDQQIFYRIKGISPFGITGQASRVISGKGVPEFSAYASIDTAFVIDRNSIKISWRVSEEEASPVTAVNILRSDIYSGPFEQLNRKPLNPKIRTFIHENPGKSNYYQVVLEGRNNLRSYSFPYFFQTEDNSPPRAPEDLSGEVDSTGKVSIAWKSNTESDLMGYKVFRANSPDEDFISLVREINNNNYCRDSVNLNTLAHKIYYRVVVIDRNYNNSEYSQILELSRPDTIPPAPGIIKRIDYSAGKVLVGFEASPSDDIVSYELFSKSDNDAVARHISSWEGILPESYTDIPSASGGLEYKLVTTDTRSNKSENYYRINVPASTGSTIFLTAEQAPDGKKITLRWQVPEGFIPVKTTIYRSAGDDPLSIYVSMDTRVQFYEDINTEINTIYNYRIILFSARGAAGSEKLVFNPASKTIKRN